MSGITFQLVSNADRYGYRFRFAERHPGSLKIGLVEMADHDQNAILPSNCGLDVEPEDMQGLMDMLWEQGFRPKKMVVGIDPDLHEATKLHLQDLRSIIGREKVG